MPERLVVSLPDDLLRPYLDGLADPVPAGAVDFVTWSIDGPPPVPRVDLAVLPYMSAHSSRLRWLAEGEIGLVQSQSIGYDGVAAALPAGLAYANASSVHETATAELALALILASQRGLDEFARNAEHGLWKGGRRPSLADRTVLILGYGGVGKAVEARLAPFEVAEVVRVASRARSDATGEVHGIAELPELLPHAEIVVIGTPLTDATRGLVGAAELALLPDGALVVNVARGPVLDTDAALAEAGRLRFALDVTDPEPLPADHPLWSAPGVLISPHVGGAASAMEPRMARLLRRQIGHLLAGEEPENVVLRS
ncbi:2-hydroxyacid dehydrogenase [Gryllotalpicola protaetiae]|uniref:Hydroxyacid dehydrogenase n=1 Tax=Gryllotalpicola protaetiae TaxID=2419771 RepID=A0A387BRN0_9MICO|nr:2-hydroxyacid dehydrogenase [Gryllotalpicola protaetiae]AYG03719.1 hydroxyacid dehydrogenase [Gryllotalpicola protaetiae]